MIKPGIYSRKRPKKDGVKKDNGYVVVRGHRKTVIRQQVLLVEEDQLLINYCCTETGKRCAYWTDAREWKKQGWKKEK